MKKPQDTERAEEENIQKTMLDKRKSDSAT
jgi:hypothetical protein